MRQVIPDEFPKIPERRKSLNANCLNDKQSAAIEMLAIGKSFKSSQSILHIDPQTLYHWRQDLDFQDALIARRREVWLGGQRPRPRAA